MLTEDQAKVIASEYVNRSRKENYRIQSTKYMPAESMPAAYRDLGDTWIVRFKENMPPGVAYFGSLIICVSAGTGKIMEQP